MTEELLKNVASISIENDVISELDLNKAMIVFTDLKFKKNIFDYFYLLIRITFCKLL